MDLRLITRVLFLRAAWRRRDHWDAAQITAHQDHALRELRRATYAGSEFYRRHHAGLPAELPRRGLRVRQPP